MMQELNAKKQFDLEVAKLSSEEGRSADPANLMAYGQQYAATGQIPTGLAKGTFGAVAGYAKALPKQPGTIVSNVTGVKDAKTPVAAQDDLTRLYNITQQVQKLKELDQQRAHGVIGGTLGKVFGSDKQSEYLAIRKSIVDDIQRMQSGAALSKEEQQFYADYIPGRFSDALFLGQDSTKKITNFEKIMNDRLTNGLANNGLSIYGYSKVKVQGKEMPVGEIIQTDDGKTYRVLPDGQLATIDE